MARLQKKNAGGSHHRFGWDIPALPARWAYELYAISLGTGCLAPITRHAREAHHELDLSTGRPGPRDFSVRIETVRPLANA
ncbi:hypothetical protein ACVILH_002115 [Bradyrhizobium sp. USDA 4353]